MGIGLLPWEKWLPPWLYGPLIFVGSIFGLFYSQDLHWWEYLLLPMAALMGAWATWVWFKHRRNIFDEEKSGAEGRTK
jgi:hypothetical protein